MPANPEPISNLPETPSTALPTQSPIEKKVTTSTPEQLITQDGFQKRFQEYREKGFSRQDAWRSTAMIVLEAAQAILHPKAK